MNEHSRRTAEDAATRLGTLGRMGNEAYAHGREGQVAAICPREITERGCSWQQSFFRLTAVGRSTRCKSTEPGSKKGKECTDGLRTEKQ
jgi:hypothetical protein